MKKEIIIQGNNDRILSISLLTVLEKVVKLSNCSWKILWLEGKGRLKEDNMIDFENRINNSNNGYLVSFLELLNFAKSIDQIIEIVLIGDKDIDSLRRYKTDKEMRVSCDYCIELIDSTYWKISSIDYEFIENLSKL